MPTVRFCQSRWTNLSAAGQICRDSCCSAERGEAAERRPRRRDRRRCRGAGRPSGAFFPPRFARRFFLSSLSFRLAPLGGFSLVASSRLASLGVFFSRHSRRSRRFCSASLRSAGLLSSLASLSFSRHSRHSRRFFSASLRSAARTGAASLGGNWRTCGLIAGVFARRRGRRRDRPRFARRQGQAPLRSAENGEFAG